MEGEVVLYSFILKVRSKHSYYAIKLQLAFWVCLSYSSEMQKPVLSKCRKPVSSLLPSKTEKKLTSLLKLTELQMYLRNLNVVYSQYIGLIFFSNPFHGISVTHTYKEFLILTNMATFQTATFREQLRLFFWEKPTTLHI